MSIPVDKSPEFIYPDHNECRTEMACYGGYASFNCLSISERCPYLISVVENYFCIHPDRIDFLSGAH